MKRRVFVGGAFAGMALTGADARPPKPKSGDIPTRQFGKTGVKVPHHLPGRRPDGPVSGCRFGGGARSPAFTNWG